MSDIRCYPSTVSNPNVPRDVFIVAHVETMSGEIGTTYYIDPKTNLMWSVCDWAGHKPQPSTMHDLCQATADTEYILNGKYMHWLTKRDERLQDAASRKHWDTWQKAND